MLPSYRRFLLCVVLAIAAASVAPTVAASSADRQNIDACTLVSSGVIEKALGEPVLKTRSTSGRHGDVFDALCLYALPTFTNSISLSVTLPYSTKVTPRELWMQKFHESAEQKEKENTREEKEAEANQPVPVTGIGEEAYWIRSFVGTLYVLQGSAFLRISLGGKWDDAARLEKLKLLAGDALARLKSVGTLGRNASGAVPARSAGLQTEHY